MRFMQTVTAKILFIGFLILILLIPQTMMKSVVNERQNRSDEVKNEIAEKWGNAQIFLGPVIEIPYEEEREKAVWNSDLKENVTETYTHRGKFFQIPINTNIEATVESLVRKRSIFEAVLYNLGLSTKGTVNFPTKNLPTDKDNILTEEAVLKIAISDVHGLGQRPVLKWGDEEVPFEIEQDGRRAILVAKIPNLEDTNVFEFDLKLKGSEKLAFKPLAENTTINLTSDWAAPSFYGASLPTTHDFQNATWKLQNFGKAQDISLNMFSDIMYQEGLVSGVKFIFPVDFYQKNERAVKYAILFIILTFVAFFLIEILQKYRLHPIQYLLVGFAMVLFYALLLSFSEHLAFGQAYLIAAAANILLISGYALAIFKNKSSAGIIGGLLVGIYAYLFLLLKSQDYALLSGTVFLFAILAVIMYLTRNIDWYSVNTGKK